MFAKPTWIRAGLTATYFGVSMAILSWFTSGDPFCTATRDQARFIVVIRLAIACTAWDLCSEFVAAIAAKVAGLPAFAPLLRAAVSAIGIASISFWIYRGYGVFLFQGTWADVSCVFSEGFGTAFPFVAAPLFAVASLVHEWLAMQLAPEHPQLHRP